jgi:hypothetical protein
MDGTGYPQGLKREEIPWQLASSLWSMFGTRCSPTGLTARHGQRRKCWPISTPGPANNSTRT